MTYETVISALTRAIELAGIAVLLSGALVSTLVFVIQWRAESFVTAYSRYRANLGRAILLGLEILIIADIIGTIAVEPTVSNLGVLGLIVVIRTFLSFALEVEISGTLPWRNREPGAQNPVAE